LAVYNSDMIQPDAQARISGKVTFPLRDKPLHVAHKVLEEDFYPHDHDFIETALITEGAGFHCTRHGEQPLQKGDLIVIAPGFWHAYRVPERLVVFNCCFGVSMLSRELMAVYQNPILARLFASGEGSLDLRSSIFSQVNGPAYARCVRSLRRMETLLRSSEGAGENYLEQIGHLLLYLGEISRFPVNEDGPIKPSSSHHPAVIRCRALLTERYAEDWTLAGIAAEISIAPKYLVRIFHESTGLAPMAYLARTRAERASLLLVNTNLPVGEIGPKVGWPDPNYFARRFRSLFGMSATEYRERFTRQHGVVASFPSSN
jgi:AraC family L-rhamnose operon transcriptional activator RhaR